MHNDLMIQLERGGLWYHVRAHAVVIEGWQWNAKDQEWTEHPDSPYATQYFQKKTIGGVPRLVPSV